jgi:hypothetical protein
MTSRPASLTPIPNSNDEGENDAAPHICIIRSFLTGRSRGKQDEFQIDTDTYPFKLCGAVYRAKFQCGRDQLPILGSLDVERIADIFHIADRVSVGLVHP